MPWEDHITHITQREAGQNIPFGKTKQETRAVASK